jgi:rSAM/selenodomain-associated transferase 2
MIFSVIVPVYHESEHINALLDHLESRAREDRVELEIIVADGAAELDTLAAVRRPGVVGVKSPPGRGIQMNAGAMAARGEIYLFLHADTTLPPAAFSLIARLLEDPGLAGGAFDLSLDDRSFAFRLIGRTASRRSRLTRLPFGDQAIFLRSSVFKSQGGFPEIPLFEDVDLMRRLKSAGLSIGFIDEPVVTSARRWRKFGLARTTLLNWFLVTAYFAGVPAEKLARFYRACS